MKKNLFTVSFLISTLFCVSQTLNINISKDHFKIDQTRSLIISHIENIESFADLTSYTEVILFLDQVAYSFNTLPDSVTYKQSYTISNNSNQFTLYFTSLPIISIETANTIVDEPKVLANFVYADSEQIVTSKIGIEIRGGSSQSYPKKTYDLEFWEDNNGEDTHNVEFGSLRSDDDWILDALYNEPLRLRSYIANKLWLKLHTPYYLPVEPEAKAGANVDYTEIFLNGEYNGIYNLSEQVDKKQLKLKSYKDDIRGELYKGIAWGPAVFASLPDFDNNSRIWGGHEMKYPKEDDVTDWNNLYDFTDFVINSTDSDFVNNIWSKFNYDNYLDYFLFLNVLRATDNTGKNIYIAKYNTNEPYFYVPWDLDGCFGTIWNGTNQNITGDILINGFHNRVIELNPQNYLTDVSNKWLNHRNNNLKTNVLIDSIDKQYLFLSENKIYERESLIYPNYDFNEVDLLYMKTWIQNRLSYLDNYFQTLSLNHIDSTKSILYPNPATNKINIKYKKNLANKKYAIHNFLGQLVKKGELKSHSINIETLQQGNYIITLNNNYYKLIVK
ncbi:CotH kinase family protein [Flavivirga rizhaonensis]|uniref:T9SS type A sorting domain-containing protein n=1 Tax=Flavivirga rizhaonensis TaxID=2559571 RepID=A0A4S1DYW0_9FLAO|nr:CotH kinase family protein [Flavivirga rizhaonensis]TGV03183.1 T9SS type A sorting domain-containing protein [Flavivirga rizhaonensis]